MWCFATSTYARAPDRSIGATRDPLAQTQEPNGDKNNRLAMKKIAADANSARVAGFFGRNTRTPRSSTERDRQGQGLPSLC